MTEEHDKRDNDGNDSADGTDSPSSERREVVRKFVVGSGIITTTQIVGDKWVKPVVDSVVLPAHAQATPTGGGGGGGGAGGY